MRKKIEYTEASKNATLRYLAKQKQIRFWVKPELYEHFQECAKEQGYTSMRQFFLDAITAKCEKV